MDAEVISYCVDPLPQEYLSKLPHHVAPCMNLHRIFPCDNIEESEYSTLLFKPFPYTSSLPIPLVSLTKLPRKTRNGIDPTTILIKEKLKWQMKKDKIIQATRKDKKNISGKLVKKAVKVEVGGKAVVPKGVALLAQHLDIDPDPYFSGVSNWYYTGGTLATLTHNEDKYLLHANQSKLNFSKMVDTDRSEPPLAVDLKNDDTIYQIVTNSGGAAVRQKSHINILSASDSDDSLQLNRIHSVSDDKHRFLSVAVQDNSICTFCTVSNNGVLKLWDTEHSINYKSRHHVSPGEGVTVTDNWSSLQYLDNNTLLLTDRCCLHVLDVRTDVTEKQLAWCPKQITEKCEQLSYVICSSRDNIVYTATTHQLLYLDLRFGFCQRWTHMMAAPPHLGFTRVMDDDQELICLGSQIMSDCVTIVNTWQGEEPHSVYQPSSLPPLAEGVHLARQHGLCLESTLTQRCTQSMTGLTCLPGDNGLYVIRQSASADVFIQHLSSSENTVKQLTEKELAAYSEWSKPITSLQRDPTTLQVTDVKDFTEIFQVLTNTDIPLEKAVKDDKANVGGAWQLSKKYLEDCVDLLAGKLLAVWEVEDEWAPAQIGTEESLIEQDPAEKVINWLDAANVTEVSTLKPTVTSTPFCVPTLETNEPHEDSPTDLAEPSPWMLQPSQVLKQTPYNQNRPAYFLSNSVLSPPSSIGSEGHRRKKQKLFDETYMLTPPKQPKSTTNPQSSAKKNFTPGF